MIAVSVKATGLKASTCNESAAALDVAQISTFSEVAIGWVHRRKIRPLHCPDLFLGIAFVMTQLPSRICPTVESSPVHWVVTKGAGEGLGIILHSKPQLYKNISLRST